MSTTTISPEKLLERATEFAKSDRNLEMLQIVVAAIVFSSAIAAQQAQPQIRVSDLEQKINGLINSERQARNLKPLVFDEDLSKIARAHSEDMIKRGFFDHVNPDGEVPRDRVRLAGYTCGRTVGENIFQNNLYSRVTVTGNRKSYDWNSLDQIAASTVKGWMHSSGHRQNILQPSYVSTGIGAAIAGNGQVYITQLFCG
jgi:uncharacterized protein YkwD